VSWVIAGVVLVVADLAAVGTAWEEILGARPVLETVEPEIEGRRRTLAVGSGCVELLAPTGDGPVGRALAHRGDHLHGVVLSSSGSTAPPGLRLSGGATYLPPEQSGIAGLASLAKHSSPTRRQGLVDDWYEVTALCRDAVGAAGAFAQRWDIDPDRFLPITSERWRYDGVLAMLRNAALDRIEFSTPRGDEDTTMFRFLRRHGDAGYMAFAESSRLGEVSETLDSRGIPHIADRDADGLHTVFVPPTVLGGVLLGLSRRGQAWAWSRGIDGHLH
jgi:hypothetical protein